MTEKMWRAVAPKRAYRRPVFMPCRRLRIIVFTSFARFVFTTPEFQRDPAFRNSRPAGRCFIAFSETKKGRPLCARARRPAVPWHCADIGVDRLSRLLRCHGEISFRHAAVYRDRL